MRGDRPRIKKPTEGIVVDIESYTENSCSKLAKPIITHTHNTSIELWVDKHYMLRVQFGDENGEREGIDLEFVQELIEKSYKHLVYYSLKHKDFLFINHPPQKSRNLRVVLRQGYDNKPTLNVVVEYHFVSLECIEVTVKTAMCKDDFELSDGQYAIEFNKNSSTLYLYRRNTKTVNTIDSYDE